MKKEESGIETLTFKPFEIMPCETTQRENSVS